MTLSSQAVQLVYAYAFPASGASTALKTSILVVLSGSPITVQEARSTASLELAMRTRKLRAVAVGIDLHSVSTTTAPEVATRRAFVQPVTWHATACPVALPRRLQSRATTPMCV